MAVATAEKPVMVVGVDESEHSMYALEWTIDHFFTPYAPNPPFSLLVIHAKPTPTSAVGVVGPGGWEVLPIIEADLKKIASHVTDKARDLCCNKSVQGAIIKVVEGDARYVLCEVVEKNHALMLVVGSHGYGLIKRALLGSVSDHCAHHANCTVMIVKRPKLEHRELPCLSHRGTTTKC